MATPAISAHPLPISIATPSRDSMTFTSTKGLLNGPGQNNCFLNSAVQVLWHLDIFRRSFRDLSGHACMADSCIFCALKELFSQLQFSNETALPPDALRRALAESFFDQQRFQLGFMDDAAECFENMLLRIHTHIAHGEAEDMCNARHCIPHQKFAMTLVEQSVCGSCGATSEPLSYTQMVHYVSTSTLVYQVRTNSNRPADPFGQLLRKAGSMGDVRVCPSACGAVIQIGRTLMNRPEIVSIGLVWNSERPTLEHIMEVFSTIGTTLRLSDVFNTVVDSRWAASCMHNLVGVVTYYGKHYSTFFFHTKLRVWIYFDDATVREVGPRWEQVVEKCRKGRYQPLLLLYALPDGTPVNTDNAPKQVTPFYNDKTKKSQSQAVLRRSVTPSPEKPVIGNTRRAITPNPDGTLNQKPPLPRPYNEYQNLTVIQNNLYGSNHNQSTRSVDVVDGDLPRKDPEYVTRKPQQINVHRTLSNGSSSGVEGISVPDHLNVPRRRDSGNWSGDRNSASSSSSTTMDNPYLYLVGKVPHGGGSVPGSPTRTKSDSSSGSSGVYDAGYDSYSLSSNDSSTMTTIQHLMKMGHLAKIPEDYNNPPTQPSQSCDVLCDEADELLVKSRQLEDEHDLVLALALCNAAATKARAAMNAPYNNPQTLTLARMKHNTCIMRARSLHRRMTQTQNNQKDALTEIRHTREGSSGSGRHSRQNSRDKGQHSRQNSRELLVTPAQEKIQSNKNIEIYATLPKKKDNLKKIAINIEDDDYALYDKPPGRESRSIFSRSKKESHKIREKRSRSEDRNKMTRDFSIAPEIITGKDTLKREKSKEEKDEKKEKDGKSKKQHKIRRKLLMGGLIKRKNRSMPDLTDANADNDRSVEKPCATVDDSNVGLKGANTENVSAMCGYLSEGHLEFAGNNTNPNLERSKLMRKSFHGSAGKILTAAKVPPPPPLRTTSQLTTSKLSNGEINEEKIERPQYPLPPEIQNSSAYYQQHQYYPKNSTAVSLSYMQQQHQNFPRQDIFVPNSNMIITRADVHQEQSPMKQNHYDENYNQSNLDSGVDEVDCLPLHLGQNFDLPPYPSPHGSTIHSRQASEDFPPPPPPLDLSALDEHLPKELSPPPTPSPGSLLAQLQNKRLEILSQENEMKATSEPVRSSGDTWLRELQAKQAALRIKKQNLDNQDSGIDVVNTQRYAPGENDSSKVTSVKDLATKFESIKAQPLDIIPIKNHSQQIDNIGHNGVLSVKKREEQEIAPEQIAEEIREVEMLNAAVSKTINARNENSDDYIKKTKLGKKKSVSFCDQVILVATAEEQEDDSYIPNPILERVLRSAMNKPETAAIRQEIMSLRETEIARLASEMNGDCPSGISEDVPPEQPVYVRRNSIDNLLSRQIPNGSINGEAEYYYNQQIYGGSSQYNAYTPYRQSPYQKIPQNAQVYVSNACPKAPTYPVNNYPNNLNNKVQNAYQYPQSPQDPYSSSPRHYPQQVAQVRQSSNISQYNTYQTQPHHPIYQHPPSPAPSNVSSNYNYQLQQQQPSLYQQRPNQQNYDPRAQYSPYQRIPVPPPEQYNAQYRKIQPELNDQPANHSPYQRIPIPADHHNPTNIINDQQNYHRLPTSHYQMEQSAQRMADPHYQRVPPSHMEPEYQQGPKYPVYQHALPPKQQLLKKSVSFEPGTKGGLESPTPKAIITPIIVNNANNSVPMGKTKCNLCRKKGVVSSNLYCTDCEFYMSRFKPKS